MRSCYRFLYLALFVFTGVTSRATPQLVRIDGSIFDSAGLPLNTAKDLQIKAYNVASGGSALWTSGVYVTSIDSGRFTLNLDATTGSPNLVQRLAEANGGSGMYFEIIYDSGPTNGIMNSPKTVRPRIRARGTMFALASATTDALRTYPISTATPSTGQVLSYDGTQWAPTGVTTLITGAYLSKAGDTMSGNLTLPSMTLTGISASYGLATDASKNLVSSGVSSVEFGYLSGATANIQTQLNSKLSTSNMVAKSGDTMTGNLQLPTLNVTGFTANTAVVTDANKNIVSSSVTATELSYLSGATANIQTQINGKLSPYSAQSANTVLAGPTTGSATPSFRGLAASDLPTLVGDSGSGGTTGAVPAPAAGDAANAKFLKANGSWSQPPYYGQSCSANYYLSGFDVSGNPVCVSLPSNLTYTRVTGGTGFTCGILSDTTVQCWGAGTNGQLGNGGTTASNVPVWVRDADGSKFSNVVDISGGYLHACALKADGTVWCWGYNANGNTGNGNTTSPQLAPVQVLNVTSATQISAAWHSTCARISNGRLKCWGYNPNGQLGDGTVTTQTTPIQVMGITSAVQVSAGTYASCAVLSDGTVRCWGYNGFGELGDGTTTNRPSLTSVINTNGVGLLSGVTMVAASKMNNSYGGTSCAIKSTGQAYCWGNNAYGQLGNGNTTSSTTPVAVLGVTSATKISYGGFHYCAMLNNGTAKCWGHGTQGSLGDNTATNRSTPVLVVDTTGTGTLSNVTDINTGDDNAATNFFSSAVSSGRILSWGDNSFGSLGTNNTTSSNIPKGAFGP